MLKFKILVAVIVITLIALIFSAVRFLENNRERTRFAQIRALQTAEFGFQSIGERAISLETGMFDPDLLKDISGETEDGGRFCVSVVKDTISADSLEIRINSRGAYQKETHSLSRRMLFVNFDSINWVRAD